MAVCSLSTKASALSTLSSLITKKMLDLEEEVSQLKIIHVAGTKGKGSTCTFSELILRCYGMRTGLFTSPHLMDGGNFRREVLKYFWWCWDRRKEKTNEEIHMPTYFRFLALLAFKIFSAEQVDVAVLEVGLGSEFDATNVVKEPIVYGITSLGYDHMEILGNTLREIAGEKAGILKKGVDIWTGPKVVRAWRCVPSGSHALSNSLIIIVRYEHHGKIGF